MFISLVGLCIVAVGLMLFIITTSSLCDTGLWLPSIVCMIAGGILIIITAFVPEILPDALMDEYYLYNISITVVAP